MAFYQSLKNVCGGFEEGYPYDNKYILYGVTLFSQHKKTAIVIITVLIHR